MGILDLIQDPTVEALIPAVLGAAGGALSGGRVQGGTRGAIGRGLLGGAEGLESGIQTAQRQQQLQMEQKHNAILDQTAAESLKELQADNARRAALRQKYPELSAYPDANLSTGLQDVLARRTFSAMQQHPKYAKALEGLDPNSYDAQTLHSIMDSAYKGQNVTPEQASVIARNNAQAKKAGEPPEPDFRPVTLEDGTIGGMDTHTGTIKKTGEKAQPKATGGELKPSGDGFYHHYDPTTKTDTKTTIPIPAIKGKPPEEARKDVAQMLHAFAPGYIIKPKGGIAADDTVTLIYPGVANEWIGGHPDITIQVPGIHALMTGAAPLTDESKKVGASMGLE